jgi:8-oxo-dGTP pyrophosphatase MutT (NUDIX family)
VTIWIDPPAWPAYGRLWSHLVSDVSVAELHEFAELAGIPRRAFEGDHYDVPEERYDALVGAGAVPTSSRDLVRRLRVSGLRFMKRHSDRLVLTLPEVAGPDGSLMRVDLFTARVEPPEHATWGAAVFVSDSRGRQAAVHCVDRAAWGPPSGLREEGETVRRAACRECHEETGIPLDPRELTIVGYERLTFLDGRPHGRFPAAIVDVAVFTASVAGPPPPLVLGAADVDAAEWVSREELERRCVAQFWWPLAAAILPPT